MRCLVAIPSRGNRTWNYREGKEHQSEDAATIPEQFVNVVRQTRRMQNDVEANAIAATPQSSATAGSYPIAGAIRSGYGTGNARLMPACDRGATAAGISAVRWNIRASTAAMTTTSTGVISPERPSK